MEIEKPIPYNHEEKCSNDLNRGKRHKCMRCQGCNEPLIHVGPYAGGGYYAPLKSNQQLPHRCHGYYESLIEEAAEAARLASANSGGSSSSPPRQQPQQQQQQQQKRSAKISDIEKQFNNSEEFRQIIEDVRRRYIRSLADQ